MAVTPEDTAAARAREAPQPTGECPRCAAPTQAFQEYCLECGTRLPPGHGPGAALAEGWRRGDRPGPEWLWPSLVALVVAVLAAAAVLALDASRDDPRPFTLVATQEPIGPPQTATTAETSTEAVPTLAPTPPPPTAAQTQTAPQSRPGGLTTWPENVDGYTIILDSLPAGGGRARATARARAASDAGLSQVGVLNSSAYPSLQPGYFVVFTGVHRAERAAVQALPAAREAGFDAAYVKRIAR